jgi:hypothetical protein
MPRPPPRRVRVALVNLLERPAKHTELRAYAGSVTGAPDEVFARLRARLEGAEGHFAADAVSRRIVQQGDWWYRGEYRVQPDDRGSRVEYEIVNVAQTAHRLAPITGRDVLRSAPAAFAALLRDLEGDVAT